MRKVTLTFVTKIIPPTVWLGPSLYSGILSDLLTHLLDDSLTHLLIRFPTDLLHHLSITPGIQLLTRLFTYTPFSQPLEF